MEQNGRKFVDHMHCQWSQHTIFEKFKKSKLPKLSKISEKFALISEMFRDRAKQTEIQDNSTKNQNLKKIKVC